ncbi:hypothetical protein AB0M20_12870 [Actinoplanes sp. NPDC051633]|uniref:hypothetical protein n=1 Tax=Actinoplanes sp. NPDC051633 TaxID=3155670 RepID=UPI00343F6435
MSTIGLARLDSLGDPADLRGRAEEALAGLEVDMRPGAPQEGADPSDSVKITVASDGAIADVSISRRWTERLISDRLGKAVLAAYRQAHDKRAWARARADNSPADDVSADSAMPDIDDERWLDWIWTNLNEATRRIEELSRPQPPQTVPADRTIPGPAGHVRLRLTGAALREVIIDHARIAERDPDAVAADLRRSFTPRPEPAKLSKGRIVHARCR